MSSIQFRSRIKPAFNYSEALNSYGVCCGTDNVKTTKSFSECFNEGGHFIPVVDGDPENVTCPDSDTRLGCCCSCSYVLPADIDLVNSGTYYTSGIRSNVSRCECNRLNGNWTEGACPESLNEDNLREFCGNPDVRKPKSCCHLKFDDNTGWPIGVQCTNVCNSGDCAELGTETYPSVFGTEDCITTNCSTGLNYSFMMTKSQDYTAYPMGSCYILENVDGNLEYSCSVTPQILCDGYWVEKQNEENSFCDIGKQPANPQKVNGKYQVQTMTESAFDDLGITAGDTFQGGVYIGKFKTHISQTSSKVYGNLNFSAPTLNSFNLDMIGGTAQQWALIVNEVPYSVPFLLEDETDIDYATSLWDGYYNTYGNNDTFQGIQTALTNTIKYQNRKGFIDYYIPSLYELYFYSAYLNANNITNKGNLISSSLFNTKYLNIGVNSSKLNGKSYVYGQSVVSDNTINYQTVLIDKYKQQTILFFRRIVLT